MKRLHCVVAAVAIAATFITLTPNQAQAQVMELQWATEGYFRSRAVTLTNLAPEDRTLTTYPINGEQLVIPEIRHTSYITNRLRIMPTIAFGSKGDGPKLARLKMQIDALDDVLWGDNNGIASAPLFATDASNQHFLGGEVKDSVKIPRAWLEFNIPVGVMRVGRMASHWGLGILANGGGTANYDPLQITPPEVPVGYPQRKFIDYFFDDDFGDNHFGSTTDRVLFITKPLAIYKTITKAKDKTSNFIMGYAYDKLSEAPYLPYEPFERRFRPFGQQGFISRGSSDDANEHVVLAVYNNPFWNQVRHTDQLRIGVYGVMRTQKEGSTQPSELDPNEFCGLFEGEAVPCVDTGSRVYIADLWWRFRRGPLYSEGEIVKIFGKTFGGVPFPSRNQKKKANITGGVVRFGYMTDVYEGILEVGHASGDNILEDEEFKQRALHPDYNVGLILFEETLRELSARTYGVPFFSEENPEGAKGFMSNGGVINANYIHPKVRWHTGFGGITVIGAVLAAWADTLADTGTAMYYADETDSKYLGTEVDLAVKFSFAGNMLFSLETGYLRFGKALKSALPNADSSFTLQSRVAFMW